MLRDLRTAAPLFLLLSILTAQQPPPTTPRRGELPCAPTAACREIKPGLSDESGQAAAQVATTLGSNSAERYRKLRRDTDELLRLALELKQSVDKANPNITSMQALKKVEQIEKLAKTVKGTIKNR